MSQTPSSQTPSSQTPSSPSPPRQERPASLAVVYFGVGFTAAAALSMVLLTVLRPTLPLDSEGMRRAAMLAPLVLGVLYGARVAWIGLRRQLGLARAMARALVPWETGQ